VWDEPIGRASRWREAPDKPNPTAVAAVCDRGKNRSRNNSLCESTMRFYPEKSVKTVRLGTSDLTSSQLAYGCWRIAGSSDPAEVTPESRAAGRRALIAAVEAGYTLLDTADVYCRGEVERIMGETLRDISWLRERVKIVTKCGVRHVDDPPGTPHRWDFSAAHILNACEGSLLRLGIETIDLYLLHRPDFLADPDEIAQAFTQLRDSGKVRHFGVSNFRPTLLTAVKSVCPMPLIVHQVEISLAKRHPFTDGTLDQCLTEKITPMAWSPLAGGLIGEGAKKLLPGQKKYRTAFMGTLNTIAEARGVPRTVIALAWLLRHPSRIVPVIGSTNPDRIREMAAATEIELSREEWYQLFKAATGKQLP
jgi:predicted oxidoreductase